MTTNQESIREEWEKEFDKEFYDENLERVSLHDTDSDCVKDFIRKVLSQEKSLLLEEVWREVQKLGKSRVLIDTSGESRANRGFQMAIRHMRKILQSLLNNKEIK